MGWLDKYQTGTQIPKEKQIGPRIEYLPEQKAVIKPNISSVEQEKKFVAAQKEYEQFQKLLNKKTNDNKSVAANTTNYDSYVDNLLSNFNFQFSDEEQKLVDRYSKSERDEETYNFFKQKNQEKKWQEEYLNAIKDLSIDTSTDQLPDLASRYRGNPYIDKLLKLPHVNKLKAAYQFFYEGKPLTGLTELVKSRKFSNVATDATLNAAQENPTNFDVAAFESEYLSPVRLAALKNMNIISDIGKEIIMSGETDNSKWYSRKYNLPDLTTASEQFKNKYGVSQNDFVEFIENWMVGRNKSYKDALVAFDKYMQTQTPNKKFGGGFNNFIVSERGQWDYPGQPTAVPTEDGLITMKGVPYPLFAMDETGYGGMIYPEGNYQFPGKMVYEIPMAQRGGDPSIPDLSNRGWLDRYQRGGSKFKTELTPEEELEFKTFYNTLPDNLRSDDPTYDIRGYWDASGRPEEFDYSQPVNEDGYYHAFSRHPLTGKILKSPAHPTFDMAVSDKEFPPYAGTYVPIIRPDGNVYMPNIEEEYKKGGWLKKYQDAGQTGGKPGPWIANLPKEEFKPKPNIPVYEDPIKKGFVPTQVPGGHGTMKTVYVNLKTQDVIETPEETRKQLAYNQIARSNNIDPFGVGILAASGAAPLARTITTALPFLDAPLTIGSTVVPGVTASNIAAAAGAGYSTAQVLDPNSELRTNPNAENIAETVLGFTGVGLGKGLMSGTRQTGKYLFNTPKQLPGSSNSPAEEMVTLYRVQAKDFLDVSPEQYIALKKSRIQKQLLKNKANQYLAYLNLDIPPKNLPSAKGKPGVYKNLVKLSNLQKESVDQNIFNKYYGNWWSDNLDLLRKGYVDTKQGNFSRFQNEPQLLTTQVPKSEFEKYRVQNLLEQEPDLMAASGNYKNEFLLPYEYRKFATRQPFPKTLPGSANSKFQSEIDWAKWNPETPNYPELISEYNAIEESTKNAGTWMKYSDGTPFDGTPEQFIQMKSSNVEKYAGGKDAAEEMYKNKLYRGVGTTNAFSDFSKGADPGLQGDRGIFTGNRDLAEAYIFGPDPNNYRKRILSPFVPDKEPGVYELGLPKGKKITYNTDLSDWRNVNLAKNSTKTNLKAQINSLKGLLERQKKAGAGSDFIQSQEERIKQLQKYYDDFDKIETDPVEFQKMRNVLGDITSTDEIARYIPSTDLRSITLQNIIDGGLGDVTIVNNRPGNYLKSLVGNVGFFDLNNPNIYKGLIPAAIGTGAYMSSQPKNIESPEFKKGGWLDKYN